MLNLILSANRIMKMFVRHSVIYNSEFEIVISQRMVGYSHHNSWKRPYCKATELRGFVNILKRENVYFEIIKRKHEIIDEYEWVLVVPQIVEPNELTEYAILRDSVYRSYVYIHGIDCKTGISTQIDIDLVAYPMEYSQPDELNDEEYNLIIHASDRRKYRVQSIDFDFVSKEK